MAVTRAQAELILIARHGPKMEAAGMDGITVSGSNADINDPLMTALLAMGITPANLAAVADSDLSGADINQLLDRAELRLCENISGNLDMVDITTGPRRESLSQLADQVEKTISRITKKIEKLYGEIGSLYAGAISLDFSEKVDYDDGA